MSDLRFLDLVKPFSGLLPGIKPPETKVAFNVKLVWTALTLLMFLVMSQTPLYGIVSSDSSDPVYWMRMILASSRGTLMELGITPIISATTVFQFITTMQGLDYNPNLTSDRELFETARKLLALIIAFGQSIVYVSSGFYGPPSELGLGVCILLVVQLSVSALVVILLDELMTKRYGLGSGISLFIATNVCDTIVWKALSPTTINTGRGPEFEGAIPALVHLLFTWPDKRLALREAFFRQTHPNVMNLLATAVVFCAVIYLQGFRISIPLKHGIHKGTSASRPINLFHTSNMPIMLQSALRTNICFASQFLYTRFTDHILVRLLGTWEPYVDGSSQLRAVSGLAYYLSPPLSFSEAILDPIHAAVYLVFTVVACAVFSKMWLEVGGQSAEQIHKELKDQNLVLSVKGNRDENLSRLLKERLREEVPRAAIYGGAVLGFLSVSSDLLGALGSGTSILLAVTTIYDYLQEASKEPRPNVAGMQF